MIVVRDERDGDRALVRRLVEAAFGQQDEADLVEALRRDGDLTISLVAEEEDSVIGYVGLSRMQAPTNSLGLGPVAVAPEHQRRGIGRALIDAALKRAKQQNCGLVFVLGEPEYYARFGFSTDQALRFPCLYSGPYFMALRLSPSGPEASPAVYAEAFNSLA